MTPMDHTGSYATQMFLASSADTPWNPTFNCVRSTSVLMPNSFSSAVSPIHKRVLNPCSSAQRTSYSLRYLSRRIHDAFGMTNHDKIDACFLKHQRRNLSCELSLLFPAHILCTQTDIFLVDCFRSTIQSSYKKE